MLDLERYPKKKVHKCIIIVPEGYTPMLYKSEPCLIKNNLFDGIWLEDNIFRESVIDTIPTEMGIYSCDIHSTVSKDLTDCGYEYDMDFYLENIKKIDLCI